MENWKRKIETDLGVRGKKFTIFCSRQKQLLK